MIFDNNTKKLIPNFLTFLRFISIPFFIASFYWDHQYAHVLTFFIFLFASITDFFDGFLARYWNVQSKLGKVLDHMADKMMIFSCSIMLIAAKKIIDWHIIAIILLIGRDFFIAGLREMLAEKNNNLKSLFSAKIKTVIQIHALCFLIMAGNQNGLPIISYILRNFSLQVYYIGYSLLWIAVLFSLYSGYYYYKNSNLKLI